MSQMKAENFKVFGHVVNLPEPKEIRNIINSHGINVEKKDSQLYLKFSNQVVKQAFFVLLSAQKIPTIDIEPCQEKDLSASKIKELHVRFKEYYNKGHKQLFSNLKDSRDFEDQVDKAGKRLNLVEWKSQKESFLSKSRSPYVFDVKTGQYWIVAIFFELKPQAAIDPPKRQSPKSSAIEEEEETEPEEDQQSYGLDQTIPQGIKNSLILLIVLVVLLIILSLIVRPRDNDDGRILYGALRWVGLSDLNLSS